MIGRPPLLLLILMILMMMITSARGTERASERQRRDPRCRAALAREVTVSALGCPPPPQPLRCWRCRWVDGAVGERSSSASISSGSVARPNARAEAPSVTGGD